MGNSAGTIHWTDICTFAFYTLLLENQKVLPKESGACKTCLDEVLLVEQGHLFPDVLPHSGSFLLHRCRSKAG